MGLLPEVELPNPAGDLDVPKQYMEHRTGAKDAERIITRQADAGMTADQITREAEDQSAWLGSNAKTAPGREYAKGYGQHAATLTKDLRDLEKGDREAG